MDVPKAVYEYSFTEILGARSPAFIHINEKNLVTDCGGSLGLYGLSNLPANAPVMDRVDFMDGLLPLAYQARRTFALWTGLQVPPEEFIKAVQ